MARANAERIRSATRFGDDEGTVLLLTLGFTVLVILLVLVVAAATELHLQRIRLSHVADEVALDSADALDLVSYYAGDVEQPEGGNVVPLSANALRDIAQARVAQAGLRAHLAGTTLVAAESPDGFTATVTVTTVVHPLFGIDALLPFQHGVTLTATSSARGS